MVAPPARETQAIVCAAEARVMLTLAGDTSQPLFVPGNEANTREKTRNRAEADVAAGIGSKLGLVRGALLVVQPRERLLARRTTARQDCCRERDREHEQRSSADAHRIEGADAEQHARQQARGRDGA
jgi:hypothetical protein